MTNYPKITEQLVNMRAMEQKMRKQAVGNLELWNAEIDKVNTEKLKLIITEIGWPTISKVGMDASRAAWLIAQHADHDLEFQKKALELIQKAAKNNEVEKKEVAYLTDRTLLKQNKKQLYGTQLTKDEEGNFIPMPLEDPKKVNARRQRVGLDTIEEYILRIED